MAEKNSSSTIKSPYAQIYLNKLNPTGRRRGSPEKSFTLSSDRTKRRKIEAFSDIVEHIAREETKDQVDIIIHWLQSLRAKPLLEYLKNTNNIEDVLNAISSPEKYNTQVVINAQILINMMRSYSSNRAVLIIILSNKIPARYASELFGTSVNTINAAKSMSNEDLMKTLMLIKQRRNNRVRTSHLEMSKFREFLQMYCPTPSGSKMKNLSELFP